MKLFKSALLSALSVISLIGCDVDESVDSSALQSSALESEQVESKEGVTKITGNDALMKRIAERRQASKIFAASVDGAYDGLAAGERQTVEPRKRRTPEDSAENDPDNQSIESEKPIQDVVPFSPTNNNVELRNRIHRNLDASDVENPDAPKITDGPAVPGPGPFRF